MRLASPPSSFALAGIRATEAFHVATDQAIACGLEADYRCPDTYTHGPLNPSCSSETLPEEARKLVRRMAKKAGKVFPAATSEEPDPENANVADAYKLFPSVRILHSSALSSWPCINHERTDLCMPTGHDD